MWRREARRIRRARLASLRLALVASALFAAPGRAQTPPPQKPELQVPVSAEVVRVDVVVTDKSGKARPGLTRDDFEVLEDGHPQAITQFEAFVASSASPTSAGVPAPQAATLAPPAAAQPPRRYVVLAVDDIHIEAANLLRVKKTLDRFLEREAPPEDLVALVTTSGARSQDFTEDRHTLRQAVARLSVQDRGPRPVDVPYITEYQAELIQRGDPEALRIAVEEILARRRSPFAEQEARTVARAVLAESIANAGITFETLHNVVRAMGALKGRKVVVFVSDGFTSGLGVDSRAGVDIQRITDAGMRSGVIVYALDSRGLQASSPGFSASNRGPVMTMGGASTFAARERLARSGEIASQEAMHGLAADTGGFLVANTNNFSDGLRRIMKDTEAYYLLAYEPSRTRSPDGKFRTIEVRLPRLKDVRIRHRKGYFGPDAKAGLRASASPGAAALPTPEDRLRGELRSALTSPKPVRDLPVSLSADFVSSDKGAPQVVVSVYVDLRDVPFARTGERRLATVDVAGVVFDESGAEVGSLWVERAVLDFTDAAYERALAKGLTYHRFAPLSPGRYRVSLAVREDGVGKAGSATQWVEIPDLGEGKPTLSSLFLMRDDGAALLPVQAHPVYGRDESLHLEFFAYNLGQHPQASPVTRTEIWRAGQLLAASPSEPIEPPRSGGTRVAHTRKIKLRPFDPGHYEVRIVLTDEQAGTSTSQRAGFRIE